jgi:tetratricopeptide (TPR) repeat protein
MDTTEQTQFTEQWASAMIQLVDFLYKQKFKDAQLSAQLTRLELPNLMALLTWIPDKAKPEQVVGLAGHIEKLLEFLNHPQALAQAVAVREQTEQSLTGWNQAQFNSKGLQIERLLDKGNFLAAYYAAKQLLRCCVKAGEKAYQGADYDTAYIYWLFGKVLLINGQAKTALQSLNKAQQRFQQLTNAGNQKAEHMISAAIMEISICLINLGQFEDAATACQTVIQLKEKQNDARSVAVGKLKLGSVRMSQQRYADVLELYTEAKTIFEALGEWGTVATVWHQIGRLYRKTKQFELAEQTYRQSLAIQVQQKNKVGEADSLGELSNLYDDMGRLEDAVIFCRQATEIYTKQKNLKSEGIARNNLANTLIKLHRYYEARRELQRAIECDKPFGHAAKPWTAWNILYDLEQATNHPQAAAEARQQAIDSFMAYRRAGGENHNTIRQLCAFMAQAMQDEKVEEVQETLAKLAENQEWQLFVSKLQAILNGDRNPKLADDPDLHYEMVVELRLLLESLPKKKGVVGKIRGWLGV